MIGAEVDVPNIYKKADEAKMMVNQMFVNEGEKCSLAHIHANKVKSDVCTAPC
jgi:hypothetical protein